MEQKVLLCDTINYADPANQKQYQLREFMNSLACFAAIFDADLVGHTVILT